MNDRPGAADAAPRPLPIPVDMSAAPHDPHDSPEDGAPETFISHLVELRERVVRPARA